METILNNEQKNEIQNIINLHEKMSKSYFWNPPYSANKRRYFEDINSLKCNFISENGISINLECRTKCSAKHIYYKGEFYINNEKVTIREIKKLLN
jgi:tRNA1(Val) A37 N6-methylase TrmN6